MFRHPLLHRLLILSLVAAFGIGPVGGAACAAAERCAMGGMAGEGANLSDAPCHQGVPSLEGRCCCSVTTPADVGDLPATASVSPTLQVFLEPTPDLLPAACAAALPASLGVHSHEPSDRLAFFQILLI